MLCEEASVLIVDDVNAMRVQLRDLLRRAQFKNVKVASNGEEAKGMMELEKFHLLLVDWHMEPTDGFDLLRYVRSHPDYSNTPFIMISAENTKERVIEAIKAGVDDYIVKPLTPLAVQNKVINVLIKRQVAE
jgi:two-component system chemotaxis response regulator CheY